MLKINGIVVDIIEIFDYHVLVQEPGSGLIYLVLLNDLDELGTENQTVELTTNVLSLEGWKEWQKDRKNKKLNKSKNKRKKPSLRLLSAND